MFSADNTGLIIVWKTSVSQDQQLDPCHQWCIDTVRDQKNLILNSFDCVLIRRCSEQHSSFSSRH